MITMSSGAFIDIGSEEMISTKTMTEAMTSAGAKAAKYKAPHKKQKRNDSALLNTVLGWRCGGLSWFEQRFGCRNTRFWFKRLALGLRQWQPKGRF